MGLGPSTTASELDAYIANNERLHRLLAWVTERMDTDPGHDVNHVKRVALWAVRLASDTVSPDELIAAALLHDIVNVPKSSPDRARASTLCADEARLHLPSFEFSSTEVDAIADAIVTHSFSLGKTPASTLGDALQDADRLEALGAIGVMRTFSTGARMGARYFDAHDPFWRSRSLDDRALSVDHFFTKLLGLAETLRTERGRAEARKRTMFLHAFLAQLGDEIGVPYEVVMKG